MESKLQLLKEPRQIPDWIFIQKTIDAYGYDPRYLKISSEKPVRSKCVICLTEREQKSRSAQKQNKCLNCSNRINGEQSAEFHSKRMTDFYKSGGRHGMKGRKHTAASRQKMSENSKGKPYTENMRIGSLKAHLGKPLSNEHKEKLRKANLGKKLTAEHRKKISKNHADVSGKKNPAYGKVYPSAKFYLYSSPVAGKIKLRSGWELSVAKWLDSHGETWFYEPCNLPITYYVDGVQKEGTYIPDFYVKSKDEYWEIKGRWFRNSKVKFEAVQNHYKNMNFVLLMREDLTEKGINVR